MLTAAKKILVVGPGATPKGGQRSQDMDWHRAREPFDPVHIASQVQGGGWCGVLCVGENGDGEQAARELQLRLPWLLVSHQPDATEIGVEKFVEQATLLAGLGQRNLRSALNLFGCTPAFASTLHQLSTVGAEDNQKSLQVICGTAWSLLAKLGVFRLGCQAGLGSAAQLHMKQSGDLYVAEFGEERASLLVVPCMEAGTDSLQQQLSEIVPSIIGPQHRRVAIVLPIATTKQLAKSLDGLSARLQGFVVDPPVELWDYRQDAGDALLAALGASLDLLGPTLVNPESLVGMFKITEKALQAGPADGVDDLLPSVGKDFQGFALTVENWVARSDSDPDTLAPVFDQPMTQAKLQFERLYYSYWLQKTGGNISEMARFIGRQRSDVYRSLRKLDLDIDAYRWLSET